MRFTIVVGLFAFWSALCNSAALAQVTPTSVPDSFFGAQRGRVVYHPRGGFRMRYGRGLTPQGAQVLTTGIQTFGPLIPQFINPVGAAMLPSQQPAQQAAEEQAAVSAPGDPILDALADPTIHSARMARLEDARQKTISLVQSVGRQPVAPLDPQPQTGGGGGDQGPHNDSPGRVLLLTVAAHPSLQMSKPDVEQIFAQANQLLRNDDDGTGSADVAVDMELRLFGNVRSYNDPGGAIGGIINTDTELTNLRSHNAGIDVLIVDDLQICGSNVINPSVVGCAVLNEVGVQVVVERPRGHAGANRTLLEAVIWAHELCHNGGARHRPAANALMSPVVQLANGRIDRNEQNALLRLAPSNALGAAMAMLAAEHAADHMAEPIVPETDIVAVVQQLYIEGVPWHEWRQAYTAARATPAPPGQPAGGADDVQAWVEDDIAALDQLLQSDEVEYHGNALAMLCAIGTQNAVTKVLHYLRGKQQDAGYAAAVSAGYVFLGRLAGSLEGDLRADIIDGIDDLLTAQIQTQPAALEAVIAETPAGAADQSLIVERAESVNTAAIAALGLAGPDALAASNALAVVEESAALEGPLSPQLLDRIEAVQYAKRLAEQAQ